MKKIIKYLDKSINLYLLQIKIINIFIMYLKLYRELENMQIMIFYVMDKYKIDKNRFKNLFFKENNLKINVLNYGLNI